METINAIISRRSIRRFEDKTISNHLLNEILRAGMHAPSARNERPWQFLVINDRKILDQIPKYHPYSHMVLEAPLAILVCADLSLNKSVNYWAQDCAAATQNMLLAIHELGLGSVWLGVFPAEDRVSGIKNLFQLPDHIIPFSLLPIGYPDENKEAEDRFDPHRIHYNNWSNNNSDGLHSNCQTGGHHTNS